LVEEGRVFGMVMHTAAHICTSGQPGEILVSQPVWDALPDPSKWVAENLGPTPLKGLFEPVPLHRVEWRVN
jgi:class 3 adenylate cyclase